MDSVVKILYEHRNVLVGVFDMNETQVKLAERWLSESPYERMVFAVTTATGQIWKLVPVETVFHNWQKSSVQELGSLEAHFMASSL